MAEIEDYITDLEYIYAYFSELNPASLRLICLSQGIAAPSIAEPFKYLELGYGQGVSLAIHAAATTMGEFWGTDFNESHAVHAEALARPSGGKMTVLDDSFVDLANRSDLPEFDFIVLHGIWSWVSDESKRAIVDLIRRKLRVGGVLYISYNSVPGATQWAALRELMSLHAELTGTNVLWSGGKVGETLDFVTQVVDSGAAYFRMNPVVAEYFKSTVKKDRRYVAHEFFNRHWEANPFSKVVEWLAPAKVSFVASARFLDNLDALNVSEEGQKLLSSISHPVLRQSVRDFLVNQSFRRDIFIKGTRKLSGFERAETLRKQQFVLIRPSNEIELKTRTPRGEATLDELRYRPIIEALADDNFAPKSFAQLSTPAILGSAPAARLFESLMILVALGHVRPAAEVTAPVQTQCASLNRYLCERARAEGEISVLASPVTGGGIYVDRLHELFLLGMQQGKKEIPELSSFVWNLLAVQGQRVRKDDKPLQTAEENVREIEERARKFMEERLPLLKALAIA